MLLDLQVFFVASGVLLAAVVVVCLGFFQDYGWKYNIMQAFYGAYLTEFGIWAQCELNELGLPLCTLTVRALVQRCQHSPWLVWLLLFLYLNLCRVAPQNHELLFLRNKYGCGNHLFIWFMYYFNNSLLM